MRFIFFYTIVCCWWLSACNYEHAFLIYEGGKEPFINVTPELTVDTEFILLAPVTKSPVGEEGKYCCRYIVEAWQEGKRVERQTAISPDDRRNTTISLPLSLRLHPRKYTLVVWSDYVSAVDPYADLFYCTEDMGNVTCREPYKGNTPYRDAFYGAVTLDLRSYLERENTAMKVHIAMTRPQARYRIVATDRKEFLKENRRKGSCTVTFSYDFYFPTGFSVLRGKPSDGSMGRMFTVPLVLSDSSADECIMGADDVFADDIGSFLLLTITIRGEGGKILNQIAGLEVPYKKGCLTTIKGRFLTSGNVEGVVIDPGYEGKTEIDLDKFLR